MNHLHMFAHARQFGVAVIKQLVTKALQGIALYKPHMTERVQRIGFFVKIGAVAIHLHIIVAENHIAFQNLGVFDAFLIKIQCLRPLQIHHRLRFCGHRNKDKG